MRFAFFGLSWLQKCRLFEKVLEEMFMILAQLRAVIGHDARRAGSGRATCPLAGG
jgi:hypothetical protein